MKNSVLFFLAALFLVVAGVGVWGVIQISKLKKETSRAIAVENVVSITQGVDVVQTDSAGWILRETNHVKVSRLQIDDRIRELEKLIADQGKAIEQAKQVRDNAQKQVEILRKIKAETGED